MEVKDILDRLRKSPEFAEWSKKYPERYLVHVFMMIGGTEPSQVGYYDQKEDIITSFTIGDGIKIEDFKDTFQKEAHTIKQLDEKNIRIELDEALIIAEKLQKEKYRAETPIRKIVVVQNIKQGQVYNVTYVTQTFKTLNIKIDSATGKVIEHESFSLIQFPQQ